MVWKFKFVSLIFALSSAAFIFGDENENPFPKAKEEEFKKAVNLKVCGKGHQSLKDIPIVYGYVRVDGDKVEKGEIILGGSMFRPRQHRVVCQTCGIGYYDDQGLWKEAHPLCNEAEARKLLGKPGSKFPVTISGIAPKEVSAGRWLLAGSNEGAYVDLWTSVDESVIILELNEWTPKDVTIEGFKKSTVDRLLKEWNWVSEGIEFELRLLKVKSSKQHHVHFEWKKIRDVDGPKAAEDSAE